MVEANKKAKGNKYSKSVSELLTVIETMGISEQSG